MTKWCRAGKVVALFAAVGVASSAWALPTLQVAGCADNEGRPEEQSCVDVKLITGGDKVASFGFTLAYDPTLLSLKNGSADVTAGAALNVGQPFSAIVTEDAATKNGRVQVLVTPPLAQAIPTIGDGTVARMCFTVAADAAPGCATLPFVPGQVDVGSDQGADYRIPLPADGGVRLLSPRLGDFACYRATAKRSDQRFTARTGDVVRDWYATTLPEDQQRVDLRKSSTVCAPAEVGDDPESDRNGYLEGFAARQTVTNPRQPRVERKTEVLDNQLGRVALKVQKIDSVMAPAAVAQAADGIGGASVPKLDHFKCYAVRSVAARFGDANVERFEPVEIVLRDSVRGEVTFQLTKPDRLCNPASWDDEDLSAAQHEDRLVCYRAVPIEAVPDQPAPSTDVSVRNRFGDESLTLRGMREVCIASTTAEVAP